MKDSRLNNKSTNKSGMKLLAAPITSWVMALMAAMCSSPVMAGAGDTANTYGLGPLNVGTAMAAGL